MAHRLAAFALGLPGAWEDHPWDHSVAKVGKKIFVFLPDPSAHRFCVKLPASADLALGIEGVTRMGYGMGAHGWVVIPEGAEVPDGVLEDWIEESYRAIAPKRLVAQLDGER